MRAVTTTTGAVLAAALGAPLGAWLNRLAYRLPRGERLTGPGPQAARPFPRVELATAALLALVVITHGADRDAWLALVLAALLVPITLIDLDHRVIPNKLTGPGSVAALAILALTAPGDLSEHVIAAVCAGGFLLVAALAYPSGMGMGDVKLAAMMGLFLGRAVVPAMVVALFAGSLAGLIVMRRKGFAEGRKTGIPFGPFLALGALVGLYAGDAIMDWYLG
jgi:leader peptidase (prepilin peptidase) / N-methyltransferase